MIVYVTKDFRNKIVELYPQLSEEPPLLALLAALLFPSQVDEVTKQPLISRQFLALLEGRQKDIERHRYKGIGFLKRFQAVFGDGVFSWQPYRYSKKMCRTAQFNPPPELQRALDQELLTPDEETKVCFVTGYKKSPRRTKAALDEKRVTAFGRSFNANEEATMILGYMNRRPSNGFTKVLGRIHEAQDYIIDNLRDGSFESQLRMLTVVQSNPVPVYSASPKGNTDRIFAEYSSLTFAKREVRDILCSDWTQVDIRNSQLTIVAHLWGLKDVQDFLNRHESVWPTLVNHLGVTITDDNYEEIKAGCKELLYSLVFGMCFARLKRKSSELLGKYVKQPSKLFSHWILEKLLKARKAQIALLRERGFLVTCFGSAIEVKSNRQARSALAQQAQAVEMRLIAPIYRLAIENEQEFQIMLHLHDGCYINFTRRADGWSNRIEAAFDAQAKVIGIPVKLEWK